MDVAIWQVFFEWRTALPQDLAQLFTHVCLVWSVIWRPLCVVGYGVVISAYEWWRRAPAPAVPAISIALACGLTHVLKGFVGRERPPAEYRLAAEASAALPSGHATAAVVVAMVITLRWGGRRVLVTVAWANAVIVCAARLYLGVHWATDLLAGTAIAVAVAWVVALAARDQPPCFRLSHRCSAVIHAELPINVDEVSLDRCQRDEKGRCDLPITRPRFQEHE